MFELSERMGMTRAELGVRMSARELTWRKALERRRHVEQEEAEEKAKTRGRRG